MIVATTSKTITTKTIITTNLSFSQRKIHQLEDTLPIHNFYKHSYIWCFHPLLVLCWLSVHRVMLSLLFLYRITISARDRLYTSEPDVCGRQVLTYKDGLTAETHKDLINTFRMISNLNQSPLFAHYYFNVVRFEISVKNGKINCSEFTSGNLKICHLFVVSVTRELVSEFLPLIFILLLKCFFPAHS